jgi:hypothetical protein
VEANCHFWAFRGVTASSSGLVSARSRTDEFASSARYAGGGRGGRLPPSTSRTILRWLYEARRLGEQFSVRLISGIAIGSSSRAKTRTEGTDVLFSLRQLWYLHPIVRCSRRIQNSGCVDPVQSSLLRAFADSRQRSVHTRVRPFGG